MAMKKLNFESEIKEAKKLTFKEKVKKAFDFKQKWYNFRHYDWKKWARKNLTLNGIGHFGWIVLRAIIVIGLCFLILYPFLVKAVVSFMSVNDITDSTVMFIPRRFDILHQTCGLQYELLPRIAENGVVVVACCGGAALHQLRCRLRLCKI